MPKVTFKKNRFIPIRLKLLSATIISGVLALLIAGAGLYCMHLLNQRLKEVVDVASDKVKLSNLLRQDLSSVIRAERNMLLVSDDKEFDRIATTMDASFKSIDTHVADLRQLLIDEDRQFLDKFGEQLAQWKGNHDMVRQYSGMDAQRQARELSLGNGEAAFNQFETTVNLLVSSISTTTDDPPTSLPDSPEQAASENTANSSDDPSNLNLEPLAVTDETNLNKLIQLAELRRDALKLQRVEKNLILQASIATPQKPEDSIQPYREQVTRRIAILKKLLDTQERIKLEQIEVNLFRYLDVNDEIVKIVQQKGNAFGYSLVQVNGVPLASECESIVNSMVTNSERSLANYEQESSSLYRTFRNALIALSLIAAAASVAISMWVGNNVAENVGKLSAYAKEIHRAKDLRRPIPKVANDEIGELSEAFDEMRIALLQQNSQLARLNESLEHNSEEMEQFVYSVSHDLKSPLVSCKGLVGLINEDLEDGDLEEVRNSAARLSTVTDQMSDTIDALLSFSRIGRHQLDLVPIDTLELVQQLCDEWRERPESARVSFCLEPDLTSIRADLISFRRIFDNLIGNAIKYAGETENAAIEIGSTREGNKVRFYVRDNGPGIEPQYHEKIFGLFQRLDTNKKGTGIGLASVAKIMRLHRGRIWVDSKPNQGATFWVEFPDV